MENSLNPSHNFVADSPFSAEGSNVFRFPIGVGNDDVEIEGSLRFSLNGNSSVLPMANDGYCGSDFYEMFCVVDWLYTCEHLKLEEVENCWCLLSPANYHPDMPGVEQWTEPLTDEVHYRWRPQKDCFYLDENIDDYLRELYEFVRMKYNY